MYDTTTDIICIQGLECELTGPDNRTTITDTGKCSYDAKAGTGYSTLENLKAFGLAVQKENTKDKQMSVSDLTTMFSIYDKDKNKHFKWCGME